MILLRASAILLVVAIVLVSAACGVGADTSAGAEGEVSEGDSTRFRYDREYVFVAPRGEVPLVVPFTFQVNESGTEFERGVRGWVARGATWDRFIDEAWRTSQVGGVWRVVPQGDLHMTAGGATEIETLRFESGERRLRVDMDAPVTGWHQGGDTRFRLLTGRIAVGAEAIAGPILEILRVERTLADGWPPDQDFDALFLTSGDSIQFVVAETIGGAEDDPEYAWARSPAGERSWDEAEIRWLDLRPFEEARRDVPRRWSFRVPSGELQGEVEAVGYDAVLGPERAGRRAVEIRFTVQGWVDYQGGRKDVVGMIRHTQQ